MVRNSPLGARVATDNRNSAATRPGLAARIAVAALIGSAGALLNYVEFLRAGASHHSDFSPLWFSAIAVLHGQNPYLLVGPGKMFNVPWPLYYPTTAFVTLAPFAWFSERVASVAFVLIASSLIAFGITRDSWHRLPLFLSASFVIAARAAQLSLLVVAGLCVPAVAWVIVAKPNFSVALVSLTTSKRTLVIAVTGGTLVLALSLFLFPAWLRDWLPMVLATKQFTMPIARWGGVLVLAALLRWRRPEARLIVAMALIPQTLYWYEGLALLLVPSTLLESLILSLVSSLGFVVERVLVGWQANVAFRDVGSLMIAFLYLPATLMVLRRPNEGPIPGWLGPKAGELAARFDP